MHQHPNQEPLAKVNLHIGPGTAAEMGLTKNYTKTTFPNIKMYFNCIRNPYCCLYFQWLTCQSPFEMIQKDVSRGSFEIKGTTEKIPFYARLTKNFFFWRIQEEYNTSLKASLLDFLVAFPLKIISSLCLLTIL